MQPEWLAKLTQLQLLSLQRLRFGGFNEPLVSPRELLAAVSELPLLTNLVFEAGSSGYGTFPERDPSAAAYTALTASTRSCAQYSSALALQAVCCSNLEPCTLTYKGWTCSKWTQ